MAGIIKRFHDLVQSESVCKQAVDIDLAKPVHFHIFRNVKA